MRVLLALATAGAALTALGAVAAAAETPTRQEYVARLEQICKPGNEATQRALKGVREDIQAERDALAAAKFRRGSRIFGHTVTRISKVPRPTLDQERLQTWFRYLHKQEGYLGQIAEKLAAGQTIKAQRLTARFIHNGNLANNVVLAFGFDYCSFRFSRFG